ncbi:ferritin-like domain-containing protein [Dokdonella sp.]|uniref:ferritin-like domain-containing protein n=1 Tax=Dokdonella sp. TaxID=2291710 RepID=UPI0035284BFC
MSFLKPASSPLRLTDFRMQSCPELAADPGLLAILKTTALVESRADNYAEYLHAVFQPRDHRWREAIEGWNQEERQHGILLRNLVVAADPDFDFDSAMQHYRATVPYHACDGCSVRGTIADELVARCVVEALASTFYRTLKDGARTPVLRAALVALARDEARHYGMFAAMLREEQEGPNALGRWRCCWVGIRRMTELGDQQIIGAYISAARAVSGGRSPALAAQRYAAALFPRYRFHHLRFAARLICPVLFGRSDAMTVNLFALALRVGVMMKGLVARGQVSALSRVRALLGEKAAGWAGKAISSKG